MKLSIVALVAMLAAQVVSASELWWTDDCRLSAADVTGVSASRSSWRLPFVAAAPDKGADSFDSRVFKPSELGAVVEVERINGVSFSAYSFCVELMRSRELLTKLKFDEARKVAPAYEEMSLQLSPGASPEPSVATLVALGMALLGIRRPHKKS